MVEVFDEVSKRDCKDETKVYLEKVGEKLKTLRKKYNLTQMDVAFYIFADKSLISAIERKVVKNITLCTLTKLAKLFKTNVGYFLE